MRLLAGTLILVILVGLVASKASWTWSRSEPTPDGEVYALLVAGSNGWYNYRHQADIAHSYHVLLNHGIPARNIIVMMYDDIANSKQNPYPGKLFNKPNGKDVYKGVKIDYKGRDVTPANFLNVLKGNSTGVTGGNGRVIHSNADDRIFVYFADHGAVGLIAFPDEMLTVKQLRDTLEWMYAHKRYSQLAFYLEACESGSMFENVLKTDINIYAITAANAHESSWGTYCENKMKLPCLGDLFSVNWMNDSDEEDLEVETLDDQFQLVKKLTNKSHVMRFGNVSIAKEPVGWFQGEKQKLKKGRTLDDQESESVSWPSREIEIRQLKIEVAQSNDQVQVDMANLRIKQIHQERREAKTVFRKLVHEVLPFHKLRKHAVELRLPIVDIDCLDKSIHLFDQICIDLNQNYYGLKYVYQLNNMCSMMDFAHIETSMHMVCASGRSKALNDQHAWVYRTA